MIFPTNSRYEVRSNNDDGSLDEIVASNCWFHLEQMDGNHWWMRIETAQGALMVNLTARGKIRAMVEED